MAKPGGDKGGAKGGKPGAKGGPKEVTGIIKLQVTAGQVTPAPPVGPALGQHGVPIGDFVSKVNEATRALMGTVVPIIITVYSDRSYDFIVKQPPASVLICKAAGIEKGSKVPNVDKVGKITSKQLEDVAKQKLPDLNTTDIGQAMKIMAGTARSMGVEITG
ncbi:MAG: 50S ribosomal protein L11 [Planctomycetota bacterium]